MLVASVAGFQPGPRMAAYFASKAYVLSLGEALRYELAGTGVGITVLCPGATNTEFFTVAGSHGTRMGQHMRRMMGAEEVASRGYRGLVAGRNVVVTGLLNRMLAAAGRFAPRRIVLPVANMMMSEK